MMPVNNLGVRIAIIGCSNAGKSMLASALGSKLNLPVYHLDTFAHQENTNWKRLSNDLLLEKHNDLIKEDSWIIDGNYSFCMEERFARATSIIWLDPKVFSALYYYLKRSLKNDKNRPGRLAGSEKEFSMALIKWIIQYPHRRLKYKKLLPKNKLIIHIQSMAELNKFYKNWKLKKHDQF